MMTNCSTTTSYTSNTIPWWLRSQYYQQFNVYNPSIVRYQPAQPKPAPLKEEFHRMTDEEFNTAFNDLLFGGKQEEANV